MNETWENGKKRNFGTDFGPFPQNWAPKNLLVSFTTASS